MLKKLLFMTMLSTMAYTHAGIIQPMFGNDGRPLVNKPSGGASQFSVPRNFTAAYEVTPGQTYCGQITVRRPDNSFVFDNRLKKLDNDGTIIVMFVDFFDDFFNMMGFRVNQSDPNKFAKFHVERGERQFLQNEFQRFNTLPSSAPDSVATTKTKAFIAQNRFLVVEIVNPVETQEEVVFTLSDDCSSASGGPGFVNAPNDRRVFIDVDEVTSSQFGTQEFVAIVPPGVGKLQATMVAAAPTCFFCAFLGSSGEPVIFGNFTVTISTDAGFDQVSEQVTALSTEPDIGTSFPTKGLFEVPFGARQVRIAIFTNGDATIDKVKLVGIRNR